MMAAPSTQTDVEARQLTINHKGKVMTFPFVWLRHNCRCEKCFHQVSKARNFLVSELNLDIKPQDSEVSDDGELSITWEDDHQTTYKCDWLIKRQLTESAKQQRSHIYRNRPELWDSAMINNIPKMTHADLMNKPESLHYWLKALEAQGLALVTGAPKKEGVLLTLGERIGYLRRGIYGHVITLKAMYEAQNLAFTNKALTFHVDMPYHEWTPGVQVLHCITQTVQEGGVSVFCDGFKVAEVMRKEYPEYFKLLTTEPVMYWHKSKDLYEFDLLSKHSIIELDSKGEVEKIHYSFPFIDFDVPLHLAQTMYEAVAKFDELLHDPKYCITFKMDEGDIVCFDNVRLLHGRTAFTVKKGNERHLEAVYIDWDLLRSKRRVLDRELGSKE